MNKIVEPDVLVSFFDKKHMDIWRDPGTNPLQVVELTKPCIDELVKLACKATDANFRNIQLTDLPNCAKVVAEIRDGLCSMSGCVIVNRFPVEDFDTDTNRRVAGIFANLIAPLIAQDISGTLLYDVLDTGGQESKTIRRSKTNHEQPFHTDGPWFQTPPNFIGLFCIQPADTGGYSQVSSLQTVLNDLVNQGTSLDQYYQDLHWNCMGQHSVGELPFNTLPILQSTGVSVLMRHYADYVRTGFQLSGGEIPDDVDKALQIIDRNLLNSACPPFRLEAGQFQFVNNYTVSHARAAFKSESTGVGRHLVRLWSSPPAA